MRKFVLIAVVFMLTLSSCSNESIPSSSEDFLESNYTNEVIEQTVLTEEYNLVVSVEDGRLIGNSDDISFNIPIYDDYPNTANIYRISSDYPFWNVPESYFDVYTESNHWFYFYSIYNNEDQWNPNIEPLYSTQALSQAFRNEGTTEGSISFLDYALSNRINIEFINLDDTCIDFLEGLNLNTSNYNEAIYCNYYAPDGTIYQKYNIPQQIDGINVFDKAVYPQYSSQLGFVNWNGYIGYVSAPSSLGTSISFSLINEKNDVCLTDFHEYEKEEIIEENLPIISLEDCINTNFSYSLFIGGYSSSDLGGDTWFYLSDLVYLPVRLCDETLDGLSEDCYLFPCWVLFYTRIIDTPGYCGEVDGVVAINAITGENIDVADEIYDEIWSE